MASYTPTDRTTVKRKRDRGTYDKGLVHGIIDEALICHVGFVVDEQPYVIPTIHTRVGESLYFHGAPANRMLKTMARGFQACVTMTLIDGLVMAKSAFHHSMNYRSVVVLGTAELVADNEEKKRVFDALVDHVAAGRADEARRPNASELRATLLLRMKLEEVSAKVRSGQATDDEEDLSFPVWAGVVPLSIVPGAPQSAEHATGDPSSVITSWTR